MPLGAGTRLGTFEILSRLGAGGMGEVYRARDERLGREVAIKTISPKLSADPDALARFKREAKAIAALSHPSILTIHDVGTHAGIWFLVTELLEGETLRRRMSRGDLTWRDAVQMGIAAADGLACAHARGIVHRDLKPENLFLTRDGRLKILDFGLARFTPSGVGDDGSRAPTLSHPTMPGAIVGTLGYGSPEQIKGQAVDARSDLFSLGCVLHEMLSGRRPFQRATAAETLAAILMEDAPPPSAGRGGVPGDLDRLVLRCLEKDPAQRFPSAQELGSALKALTGPGGERPRPPSVAVLPFVNLSTDPENEFFADGLTEDVIAHLSKVRSLKVISRTSVMLFKKRDQGLREIAAALGAATLLEGSVRRAGSRVRIVAQLIEAATDQHV